MMVASKGGQIGVRSTMDDAATGKSEQIKKKWNDAVQDITHGSAG